jgi:hypothetical protein
MRIELEIPDVPELEGIADEDLERMIEAAVCTKLWYEHTGVDVDLSAARAKVVESSWTRKPTRSFLTWLKAQSRRDDVIGDLAQEAARDPQAPSGRATKGQWRAHLGSRQHLAEALDRAWSEFLGSE